MIRIVAIFISVPLFIGVFEATLMVLRTID